MSTHCQRGIQSDARHFVTFAFCTLLFLFSYDFFHLLLRFTCWEQHWRHNLMCPLLCNEPHQHPGINWPAGNKSLQLCSYWFVSHPKLRNWVFESKTWWTWFQLMLTYNKSVVGVGSFLQFCVTSWCISIWNLDFLVSRLTHQASNIHRC